MTLDPHAYLGQNIFCLDKQISTFTPFLCTDNLYFICLISLALILGLSTLTKKFSANKYSTLWLALIFLIIIKAYEKNYYVEGDDKLLVSLIIILLVGFWGYLLILKDQIKNNRLGFEIPILGAIALFGIVLTLENAEGLIIFLGLEMQAFTFYTLISLNEKNISSAEGALKYFLLGAIASGLFILGLGLIYGSTGETNFINISEIWENNQSLLTLGGLIITLGLLFKIGAAHFTYGYPMPTKVPLIIFYCSC